MNDIILKATSLSKRFKAYDASSVKGILGFFRRKYYTRTALDKVSFEIKKGEIVALLGKNGSGKSTLIKIIIGVLFPENGDVTVLGLNPWQERVSLANRIGVVLGAHGQLYWNLPALDTFNFIREIRRIPKSVFDKNLKYLIDLLELKDVYKRPVRTLSLGEQMKCNFVASVIHNPELIILDEPTIGVDLPSKTALRNAILSINKRKGTTFLITTHIVEDISVANRIILLNKGQKVFDGSRDSMEKLFGDKVHIELNFVSNVNKNFASYGKILSQSQHTVKIELDRRILKEKRIESLLYSKDVHDYKVSEPGLTYILSKFYARADKKYNKGN